MSDHYVGEIRIFSRIAVPQGWAACNGQTLNIAGNEALFSLLGVQWGGDGVKTFALPNLNGRVPVGQGKGTYSTATARTLGQTFGLDAIILTAEEVPAHNHTLNASSGTADTPNLSSTGSATLSTPTDGTSYYVAPSGATALDAPLAPGTLAITNSAGNGAHNNLMPGIGLQYMIALQGLYPQRS